MSDWSEVARQFWGPRFEEKRLAGLSSEDFKTRCTWKTFGPTSYRYFRDADCKHAAERLDNFARCMREVGMLAMMDKRYGLR